MNKFTHLMVNPKILLLLVAVNFLVPLITKVQALTIGGNPLVNPANFRITQFATGLNYPTSLIRLSDGSIVVSTNEPINGFFNSTGQLLRLVDNNQDGIADSTSTLFTGLPGGVNAIRQAGNFFFVTSTQSGSERISVLQQGATPVDPLNLLGSLNFTFLSGSQHTSYALAINPVGNQGKYDLLFNTGSQFNNSSTTNLINLNSSEFGVNALLKGDSIYKISVDVSSIKPIFGSPQQIADGLRNAAGLEFQSGTGDLYFIDNGIDGLVDASQPLSADELNILPKEDLGVVVKNYGFPDNYIQYQTGLQVGSGGVQPLVTFQPIPDPITGAKSEGAAGIAFAPSGFPEGLNNGVFITFFGDFGAPNNTDPLIYFDLNTGEYFHFISAEEPGIGHLNGLLATEDSLFVTDLASNVNIFDDQGTGQGIIYQIQSTNAAETVPEPISFFGTFIGLVFGIFLKRKYG